MIVPDPFPDRETVRVRWSGGWRVNVAFTVQVPVIGPVVYVFPARVPPHPVTDAEYPALGVTVKVVVAP